MLGLLRLGVPLVLLTVAVGAPAEPATSLSKSYDNTGTATVYQAASTAWEFFFRPTFEDPCEARDCLDFGELQPQLGERFVCIDDHGRGLLAGPIDRDLVASFGPPAVFGGHNFAYGLGDVEVTLRAAHLVVWIPAVFTTDAGASVLGLGPGSVTCSRA